jgi:ribosomal protein L37E
MNVERYNQQKRFAWLMLGVGILLAAMWGCMMYASYRGIFIAAGVIGFGMMLYSRTFSMCPRCQKYIHPYRTKHCPHCGSGSEES